MDPPMALTLALDKPLAMPPQVASNAMKTSITLLLITYSAVASAQKPAVLSLWAEPRQAGHIQQSFTDTGLVEELRIDLQGEVSSVEVAQGFTVTFYDREEGEGPHSLKLSGPCTVEDLEAVPMGALRANWDGAIGSVRIERSRAPAIQSPVLAVLNE